MGFTIRRLADGTRWSWWAVDYEGREVWRGWVRSDETVTFNLR